MNLAAIRYAAKDRLLDVLDREIERPDRAGGVADQLTRNVCHEVRDELAALNRLQAAKVEAAIMVVEYYDPAADKWGFGPRTVSPCDYAAFIAEAAA